MKKILAILLAAIMVLSFAGCGAETEVSEEEITEPVEEIVPEEVFYSLGDTVKTESIEFTLDEFDFYKCLSNVGDENCYNPIAEDDESAWLYYRSSNPYNADDDHIMARISFTYKNIGKTAIHNISGIESGHFFIEYGDGYSFGSFSTATKNSDGDYAYGFDIEPLSDAVNGRGALKVPIAVMENTEEQLLLIVKLDGQEFKYKIR